MSVSTEKITLTLDRNKLELLSKKAKKSMSEYVRDLIDREAKSSETDITISTDIREMRGALANDNQPSKDRLHESAKKKLRDYDRS